MVRQLGIASLLVFGLAAAAPPAAAQYAAPPPPPAPPSAVVPPPAPVRVTLPARPYGYRIPPARCNSCTIRCPGARRVRTIYRYRYRVRVRRCPSCRCSRRRYNKPLHRKGGPYVGFGVGYLGLVKPEGAYGHLTPKAMLTTHLGWNFNPIFALELGYQGGLFANADRALGDVKNPSLAGVTLDLKFRLVRPRRYTRVIPYLQTGLGVYFARAVKMATTSCDDDKAMTMAYGGGVQVGGGLDIYLAPWAVLGAKVLYRPLFMSALRCGPGADARCSEYGADPLRKLHGLSAELTLAFTWPG